MNILGKSKTKNLEVNNKQEVKPISYKAYLSQEKEGEKLKIKQKISEVEAKYNEMLEEYFAREDVKAAKERCHAKHEVFNVTEPTLVNLFNIVEALKKQLNEVELRYPPDLELNILANHIDRADSYNEAIDIMQTIIVRFEALVPDINKAMELFIKNGGDIPAPVFNVSGYINSLLKTYYSGIGKMSKFDKEELINKFNTKEAIVNQARRKKEGNDNLKKQLDELNKQINKKDSTSVFFDLPAQDFF